TSGAAGLIDYHRRTNEMAAVDASSPQSESAFDFGFELEPEPEPAPPAEPEPEEPVEADAAAFFGISGGLYEDPEPVMASNTPTVGTTVDSGSFDDLFEDATTDSRVAPVDQGPIKYDARKLVRQAMEEHIEGADAKAVKLLRRAIDMEPRVVNDQEALNIAAAITLRDGHEAMRIIQDDAALATFFEERGDERGDNPFAPRNRNPVNAPSWTTAWMDIGIFVLVVVVGAVSVMLVATTRLTPVLEALANNPTAYPELYNASTGTYVDTEFTPVDLQEVVLAMRGSTVSGILAAVQFAFETTISIFFSSLAIHFAAVSVFGGTGPMSLTVDKLFNFNSVILGVSLALALVCVFLVPTSLPDYVDGSALPTLIGVLIFVGVAAIVMSLVSSIGQIMVVSNALDIGFFPGCFSIIIGGIILAIVQFIIAFVVAGFVLLFAGF
ncbi:MAG: hypothetical protein AAF125_24005, partial [Chloroflexota bacterium]